MSAAGAPMNVTVFQRARRIAVGVVVVALAVSCAPPSAEPTPYPSPTPGPFAIFDEGAGPVLTFEGIGPVELGKPMGEVGDGVERSGCGSLEGLPDNMRIELEDGHEGNVVRITVHAPYDGYDFPELTGVRTIHGIEFGDDVDAVSDALGMRVVVEEVVTDNFWPITLFQVTLRESIGGIERVMTINFGQQKPGEPKPELKVRSLQVALAGHEGPPWHCAA